MLFFQTDKQLGQRTLKLDSDPPGSANGGELNAKGSLELFKDHKLQLDIVSKAFNPARIDPQTSAKRQRQRQLRPVYWRKRNSPAKCSSHRVRSAFARL